jgi:uncharacterized protein YjbI with pentapeptide repeats
LRDAKLSEADISGATLEGACLEEADLTKTQALGVDFHQAILTGACIEAWNIDSTTQLEGTICDYVYLLSNQRERRPSSGAFAPGEFSKLFTEVLNTIDLIFHDGVDWRAFVTAFDKLRVENAETELTIQSIANKGDGVVVVRVNAPADADKSKLHTDFNQFYEMACKALEEKYQAILSFKDEQIEDYRKKNADMLATIKFLADKPTSIENVYGDKKVIENEIQMNFHGTVTGAAGKVVGNQNIVVPEQQQTLAEAAQEIQQLLAQLQTQGYSSQDAQQRVANDFATQAQSNPTVKNKLMRWGQYLGDAAANGVVGDVAVEVIKLALRLSGIPLP